MTDGQEKHEQILLGAIADGIWQGHRRRVSHYRHDWAPLVTDSLHAAGFRILGPDDVDPVTWHPIETAPKDGTKIDLWCVNHLHYAKAGQRVVNVEWGVVRDWMGNEREDWRHGFGEDLEPTHWMPVPAPPAIGRKA